MVGVPDIHAEQTTCRVIAVTAWPETQRLDEDLKQNTLILIYCILYCHGQGRAGEPVLKLYHLRFICILEKQSGWMTNTHLTRFEFGSDERTCTDPEGGYMRLEESAKHRGPGKRAVSAQATGTALPRVAAAFQPSSRVWLTSRSLLVVPAVVNSL